ncbi:MAG: DUF3473 domain-containing protein [Thermoguttaceae bacterium]|nr:DUF3473 domain-containing protein [Thermoguttaceae bacterium]MBP3693403.1 DUF3473 domain-containing protein [Thermoguttaceae bacterium]
MAKNTDFLNAFTVDVEDFYQVSAFEKFIPRSEWENYPQRILESLPRILDLTAEMQTRGTFFILGWQAEKHPGLVRSIADAGHEIGFHSFSHSLIYEMEPEMFREELRRGKAILEDLTGRKVEAFRAPSFSITKKSLWALDILAEEGFRYDSSIFPIYHDRYGIPDAPREIHQRMTSGGLIWEFPPTASALGPVNLPVSGGGYFRLYPYALTRHFLKKMNRKEKRPFIFYVHPWEVDPEQPRLPFGSRAVQFRHRVGLGRNLAKLRKLLRDFSFGTLSEAINYENKKKENS